MLQVHQDTDQLRTLISILSNDCDVFIHFDKKQCSKTLSDWIDNNCFTYKVSLIKSRVKVYWAHESQIYATLNLIKEARSYSNYKFYTLLSGDCFPVKPVSEYIQFLSDNPSKNFIKTIISDKYCYRILLYHFGLKSNYYRKYLIFRKMSLFLGYVYSIFIKREQFVYGDIGKGSQWFTLNNDFISYLFDNNKIESYEEKIKNTNCIDEMFFQSLLLNSPFKKSIVNNNLRYIKWDGRKSLGIINENDLELCSDVFFCRKVSFTLSPSLKKIFLEKVFTRDTDLLPVD
ncbi:hypothetical protein J4Y10_22105 [Escherichia coli]